MENKKQFFKKDHIKLDTLFCLLPIFTIQKTYKFINIKDKINGYDFEYQGYNLSMNRDFKIFCLIIKNKLKFYNADIKELMKEDGIKPKNINRKSKDIFYESLKRLSSVKVFYSNYYRHGSFSFIYDLDYNKENDQLKFFVNENLLNMLRETENDFFLNYEELNKKYGLKLYHKKLYLLVNCYKSLKEVDLKYENILKSLGVNKIDNNNKKTLRKVLKDLKEDGVIKDYKNINKDFIKIYLRDPKNNFKILNKKQETKSIKKSIPF